MVSFRALFTFTFLLIVGTGSFAQFSGSLSPDFKGGNNFNLQGKHGIGNARQNVVGSLGLSGNTGGGPLTSSLGVDYNRDLHSAGVFGSHTQGQQSTVGARGNLNLFNGQNDRLNLNGFASKTHTATHGINKFGAGLNFNDHSASFTKSNIPGVASQSRLDGNANLFKSDRNRLDANAFKSNTKYVGGPSIGSHGAGLDWNNAKGHGASVGFDRTPAFKETNAFVRGNANLWQSNDHRTSLDAFGTANKAISGPSKGKTDFGAGFGLNHRF